MDILVVEPVRADFLLVQRHLTQRPSTQADGGVHCRWVSDLAGVEAALAAQLWSVVLSDYTVPGVEFLELLALFRERQPDVPVILVSGSVGEELAVDLLKHGLWDFVLENNLAQLTPIIERSLREAGDRAARRQAEATLRMVDTAMTAAAHAVTRKAMETALAESQHALELHEVHLEDVVAARTADNVVDFSRLEARMLHLASEPIDLPRLLEGALVYIEGTARSSGIELRLTLGPGLPRWVRGDPQRINQVVVNLLSNAVKFTERGNVTLSADQVDGGVTLRVTDTGVGMTHTQLARLFLPVEQPDPSTTRRFGGTGLGLAITRRLVDLMKGTIEVSSGPGTGSAFTVRLPLAPAQPSIEALHQTPAPIELTERPGSRLRGIRVLAAEDNAANRLLLGEMLRLEGARLTLAEDGQEAFDVLEGAGQGAFDLVLTDIQMPVMDGYTLARKIGSFAPSLPVIGLTALAMDGDRTRCLDAGMVAHLSKPIDMKLLVSTVRKYARTTPNPLVPPATPTRV